MRTFRFALQPALDAAVAREREAAIADARARSRLDEARHIIALLDVRASQARKVTTARSASAWIVADWYLSRLRDLRVSRDGECVTASERAVHTRDIFGRCSREMRALDLLRERRFAEHRARSAMLDAAELDESNARIRGNGVS